MQITKKKKTICWILSVLLCTSLIPELAFAGSSDPGSGAETVPEQAVRPEDAGKEQAIEQEKKADSTTYDLGMGQHMTVLHGGQVRYKNEEGELVDYDPSLVKVEAGEKTEQKESLADYAYENKEGDKKQYLPEVLSEETPVLMEYGDLSISFSPTEQTLEQVKVEADALRVEKETIPTIYQEEKELPLHATYGSRKGGNVSYTSSEHGIKETLILKEKPESNVFTYRLHAKGLSPKKNLEEEEITFYDKKTGDIAASISAPFMDDASGDAYSEAITYDLKKEEGKGDTYQLVMTVDQKYLEDAKRVYPVTIDPTVTWVEPAKFWDAYAYSGSPGTNYFNDSAYTLIAGKGAAGIYRTYLNFSDITKTTSGNTIESAKLTVYEGSTSNSGRTIGLHKVDAAWKKETLNWNNMPAFTSSAISSIKTTATAKKAYNLDVLSYVRGIASGGANYGLMMKSTSEAESYGRFYGSRHSTTAYRPKLTVVYKAAPSVASKVSASPKYMNGTTATKVSWEGIISKKLQKVQYRVAKCADDGTILDGSFIPYSTLKTTTASNGSASIAASKGWAAGRYRVYVRGIDTGGAAGAGKGVAVYVDKTKPTLPNASLSSVSTQSMPSTVKAPTLTWNGIVEKYLKQVEYSVDGNTYIKAGTGSSGSADLNIKGTGTHTIKVRAIDMAGNTSPEKSFTYYIDDNAPTIGSLRISTVDTDNNDLGDNWTKDPDPTINFDDVVEKETQIKQKDISYALVAENKSVVQSDFNAPKDLSMQISGDAYKGSFRLIKADQDKLTGSYKLIVQMKDRMGNIANKTITYQKDIDAPTANLKVIASGTGKEVDTLKDTVTVVSNISDKGSGIKTSSMKLYQATKEGEILEGSGYPKTIFDQFTQSTNKPFNTKEHQNGTYRLELKVQDKVGLDVTVHQVVKIENPMEAPHIASKATKEDAATISWSFAKMQNQKEMQYKIEGQNDWASVPHSNTKEGTFSVAFPAGVDQQTVYVQGVDQQGISGKEASVNCVRDQKAPEIKTLKFQQGKLSGTVCDDHILRWNVSIKGQDEEDTKYEQILEGKDSIQNGELGFIDLSNEKYKEGEAYLIQVEAEDIAGNKDVKTLLIRKPSDGSEASYQAPDFRIKRPSSQEEAGKRFILPTNTTRLDLTTTRSMPLTSSNWYINNKKVGQGQSYVDDFSTDKKGSLPPKYTEDTWYPVTAVCNDIKGIPRYSSTVIKNGYIEKALLSLGEARRGFLSTVIQMNEPVVSFRLLTEPEDKNAYEVRIGDGSYEEIQSGKTYQVSDLCSSVSTKSITVSRQEEDRNGEESATVTVQMDTLEEESFQLSKLENFVPEELTVKDKINYKTYVKWDTQITEDTTTDISYEVYRGTEKGFKPSEKTLAATGVRAGYFSELNVNYSKQFFYRICAVKKDKSGKVITRSSFSPEVASKVVDAHEYTKRMGIKDYWEYADFEVPNGTARVEKSKGNFVYQQIDVELPNEKSEVKLTRTYNSQSSAKTAFGIGWSHNYDMELLSVCDDDVFSKNQNIVFKDETGTFYQFIHDENKEGSYTSSMGSYLNLKKEIKEEEIRIPERDLGQTSGEDKKKAVIVKSDYTMQTTDQLEYRFNSGGQLVYATDSDGNFQLFEYDDDKGLLNKVITNKNIAMELTYHSGSGGQDPLTVQSMKLPDGSQREYKYEDVSSDAPRLTEMKQTSSKDNAALIYRYAYDRSDQPKMISIYDALDQEYQIDYTEEQATTFKYPDKEQVRLTYAKDATKTTTQRYIGMREFSKEEDTFHQASGNCTSKTNEAGEVSTFTYEDDLLLASTRAVDYQKLDWDSGLITHHKDLRTETTDYNENENILAETGEDGDTTIYTYEEDEEEWEKQAQPLTVRKRDENGTLVLNEKYQYDEDGNEILCRDLIKDTATKSKYDEYGEVLAETIYIRDAKVSETSYHYTYGQDGSKTERVTEIKGPSTITTTTVYDALGRELSTKDTTGKEVMNQYDGFGRLISETKKEGEIVETNTYVYDANGNVTKQTDGERLVTSYAYDNRNREVETTVSKPSADIHKTWMTDYAVGQVLPRGGIATEPINVQIETERNPDGEIYEQTFSDPMERIVREMEGGVYTDYTYDNQEHVLAECEASQSMGEPGMLTVSVFNAAGDLTDTIKNPEVSKNGQYKLNKDSIVTSVEYGADSKMTASIDGEGHRTEYAYDNEQNLSAVKTPDGNKATYDYERADSGEVVNTMTDAMGHKNTTKTDIRGLTSEIADLGKDAQNPIRKSFTYDDTRGNKVMEKDREGNFKRFTYDDRNRVIKIEFFVKKGNDNKQNQETLYTYDLSDNITSMKDYEVDEEGKRLMRYEVFKYDAFKDLVGYAEGDGCDEPTAAQIEERMIHYTYDIEGNLMTVDYPQAQDGIKGLEFSYSGKKRLMAMHAKTANGNKVLRQYAYDSLGRVDYMKDYRNFITGDTSTYTKKTYSYDAFDRPTSITYMDGSGTSEAKEAYTLGYDKNDNVVSKTMKNIYPSDADDQINQVKRYTYDEMGRLTDTYTKDQINDSEESISYTYDKVGNKLTEQTEDTNTSYAYNTLNQLIRSEQRQPDGEEELLSNKTFSYDKNGNLIQETDSVGKTEKQMSYDSDNRLAQYELKKDNNVERTQSYKYNGDGQRIQKTEDDVTKNYYYDRGEELYTSDANGDIQSWNLIDPLGDMVTTIGAGAAKGQHYSFYHTDDLGSTTNLINEVGQSTVSYQYSDFGQTEAIGEQEVENEIAYTGAIYDEGSELYYLNARYYSPGNGRFMTQDTYRGEPTNAGSWNLYAYCENNPATMTDPTGHWGANAHDGDTRKLAKKAGFKKSSRKIIGEADAYVDDSPITNPVVGWSWHFDGTYGKGTDTRNTKYLNQRKKALDIWKAKKKNYKTKSLKAFGKGLHPRQDKYAHLDWSKRYTIHWAWLNGKKNLSVFDWRNYGVKKAVPTTSYIATKAKKGNSKRYKNCKKDSKAKLKAFRKAIKKL